MPFIEYKTQKFYKKSRVLIDQANDIIGEYQADGYDLTLRQLYYQLVARDVIPNSQKVYSNLDALISDARLAGLIDWDAIVDRTRDVQQYVHHSSPKGILEAAAATYRIDTRQDQAVYIEVWVEKEALIGVIGRICKELDVPYFACRGYVSQSALWDAAYWRFEEEQHRDAVILHLGDLDPSGVDMTRDLIDRLKMFNSHAQVKRIALSMEQVEQYAPPPNPAKETDTRCRTYTEKYGDKSWELDSLDPKTLSRLVQKEVDSLTQHDKRHELKALEAEQKASLAQIARQFGDS